MSGLYILVQISDKKSSELNAFQEKDTRFPNNSLILILISKNGISYRINWHAGRIQKLIAFNR